jgi:hypothetical protein
MTRCETRAYKPCPRPAAGHVLLPSWLTTRTRLPLCRTCAERAGVPLEPTRTEAATDEQETPRTVGATVSVLL